MNRRVLLFLAGAFLSNLGSWLHVVGQAWLVAGLSRDAYLSGFITFMGGIPLLFLSLPGGAIADRFPRRRTVAICQSVLMVNAGLLFVLVRIEVVQVWHVAVISFLSGCAIAVNNPSYAAILAGVAGERNLRQVITLNAAQFQFSRVAGPAVAGLMIDRFGVGACFLGNILSFLFFLFPLLLSRMDLEPRSRSRQTGKIWKELAEGLRFATENRAVRDAFALIGISSLLLMPYLFLLPFYVQRDLGLSATVLGQLWMISSVGSFAATCLTKQIFGKGQTTGPIAFGAALGAVALLCFANVAGVRLLYCTIFVLGFGIGVVITGTQLVAQSSAPLNLQGRVMGIMGLLFQGLFPVGTLMIAAIAQFTSIAVAWSGSAAVVAVVLIARAYGARCTIRRRGRHDVIQRVGTENSYTGKGKRKDGVEDFLEHRGIHL